MGHTMKNCKVQLSADGTSWTDVSADANMIGVSGFELETEGVGLFQAAKKELTAGGFGLGTVTVRALYEEAASTAWAIAEAAYAARSPLYVRWSPRGGSTGQFQFTTDAGYVKNPVWPQGEDGPASILVEIAVETPGVTKATV